MPAVTAASLLLLSAAVSRSYGSCNSSLPWVPHRNLHKEFEELSDAQLENVLRCPTKLHGCREQYLECEDMYYVTCSCSEDCVEYGDCCWGSSPKEVHLHAESRWSCEEATMRQSIRWSVYLVSGCKRSWPADEIRHGCEASQERTDRFFQIPVTGPSGTVTYKNGFCALCNYDIENATFWNTSLTTGFNPGDVVLEAPHFVAEDPLEYLRPCSGRDKIGVCPIGTTPRVTYMCQNHFAPVLKGKAGSPQIYKNAYCALCNGDDLRDLSCASAEMFRTVPPTSEDNWPEILRAEGWKAPNLATIIRPVESRPSCFSWYGDKCYITELTYKYRETSSLEPKPNWNNSTLTSSVERNHDSVGDVIRTCLTVISLSLSLLCVAFKVIVFVAKRKLMTFSSRCTICLSVTLFVTHFVFLLVNSFDVSFTTCTIAAIVIHYGFLSTFVWTTVLTYDIWRAVFVVSTTLSQKLISYCAIGWGAPLFVISISAIVNWAVADFVLSPHYGEGGLCFINSWWSHMILFLLPMAVLLFVDIGFYVHTVVIIKRTQREANRFDFSGKEKRTQLLLFVKLAFIMGTPWIVALVSAFVNSLVIDCISILLIGFQGVYLFFGFKDYRLCMRMVPSKARFSELLSRSWTRSSTSSELPLSVPVVTSPFVEQTFDKHV